MARMQRATIEEAATSLEVIPSAIELQLKAGSLASCQDPLSLRCVWMSGPPKSTLNRRPNLLRKRISRRTLQTYITSRI